MNIENVRVEPHPGNVELSARLNGYRLWFRVPDQLQVRRTVNPFVAAAFFPAAVNGGTVVVPRELAVSPKLQEGMRYLQDVFGFWNQDLNRFTVDCRSAPAEPRNRGVGSFFSGGVDSFHTLLLHRDEITHLLYMNGFDFRMPPERFEASVARLTKVAERFEKILVPIDTNFLEFNARYNIARSLSHGSCLASTALAVGLEKVYIPSSYTYRDLGPWGTHPLLDHHWSTEATQIVHDTAAATRSQKTARIAQSQDALDTLAVCWWRTDRNCGECGKCLRTRIALRVLGVQSVAFPDALDTAKISKLQPKSDADLVFFMDNLRLALDHGDRSVARALRTSIARHRLRSLLKEVDHRMFNGGLLRLHRRLRHAEDDGHAGLIGLTSAGDRPY